MAHRRGIRTIAALLVFLPACAPEAGSAAGGSATAIQSSGAISDSEARALLPQLSADSADSARGAIARIVEANDTRFVAAFIELVRATEVGLAGPAVMTASAAALKDLTGEDFGTSWPDWVEWYAGTDLAPPPGFTGWKGRLLAGIDPRFAEILSDEAPHTVRVEEIVWGGVAYEGIPALDHPTSIPAREAEYLQPEEPVFGIAQGGEARAYPLRILDWHEMVNDTVGGRSLSLAYCTLCGAGIAYASRASDGRDYDFGSSGFLMRSNKLMVDRQTRSLWNQFTGRPVLGPLAAGKTSLERLPVVVTPWKDWRARHPDTSVLSLDTGFTRPYTPGAAYGGYFASEETMFPVLQRSRLLPAKARVYGIELSGVPKAYPLDLLTRAEVVNDDLNGTGLVLLAASDEIRVEGRSVRTGPATYSAGAAVRAYRSGERRFRTGPEDGTVVDESGRSWNVTEDALVSPDGERAERVAGFLSYWFGWNAYYPGSLVYREPEEDDS